MALVENNDVVQTISPDRADYPFDERLKPRPSPFPLQNCDLLAEGEVFQV